LNQTVNIIGAGLAGSITAALLRREGFEARVIDDGDSKAGSNASSNLFIASWLKKFSSAEAANGINIIESLYGPTWTSRSSAASRRRARSSTSPSGTSWSSRT
jgi:flavin-dependent dehydrogenase